jgi:hypothetical protein
LKNGGKWRSIFKKAGNNDPVTEFEFVHMYIKGIKIEMTKWHPTSNELYGITHL